MAPMDERLRGVVVMERVGRLDGSGGGDMTPNFSAAGEVIEHRLRREWARRAADTVMGYMERGEGTFAALSGADRVYLVQELRRRMRAKGELPACAWWPLGPLG